MSKLQILRTVDPILTSVARGYSNESYIGTNLFPIVNVEKEGGKIPLWGKESFKLWNTARAIRANSNEMDGAWLDLTPYAMTEHDIQARLDYREIEEAMLQVESRNSQMVMDQILLGYEKEQADLALNPDTYPEDNKVILSDDYFNEAEINFIEVIHEYKAKLASIIAKDANTLVIGKQVWNQLKFHPKLKGYLTAITEQNVIASIAKLKEVLEVDNILIGGARYSEDGETFDFIWGNAMVLAYVTPPSGLERNIYEPCFGYTLKKKGYPYADKYEDSNGKIRIVRATDMYDIKVVGAESGFLIKNPIDPDKYGYPSGE